VILEETILISYSSSWHVTRCHSVSEGARGSPIQRLHSQVNHESPWAVLDAVCLVSRCATWMCIFENHRQLDKIIARSSKGGGFFFLFRFDELGPTFMRLLPRSGRWCGLPSICVALPYLPPLPPIGARNKSVPERAALSKMEHHTGSSGIH